MYQIMIREIETTNICRSCLNAKYHTVLQIKDCSYRGERCPCRNCGKEHRIVRGLRLRGIVKILLRKNTGQARRKNK